MTGKGPLDNLIQHLEEPGEVRFGRDERPGLPQGFPHLCCSAAAACGVLLILLLLLELLLVLWGTGGGASALIPCLVLAPFSLLPSSPLPLSSPSLPSSCSLTFMLSTVRNLFFPTLSPPPAAAPLARAASLPC